ncbi:MAG: PIG-L family deacetylase [Methanobrevibacter sp.]|jgi:LmbE family N-acetylglucosaminyl deacetylase|nr:PIG-L family deacetylase [Candidatus Methanovirga procula]
MRHNEAITALSELGLNEANITFLGYPDQGLKHLFLNNWDYNNLLKRTEGSNQNMIILHITFLLIRMLLTVVQMLLRI